MRRTLIPTPLRRATFRQLWAGMAVLRWRPPAAARPGVAGGDAHQFSARRRGDRGPAHAADAVYQARIQAITSMAFALGFSLGMLWAGVAIDRFGLAALVGGGVVLALLSAMVASATRRLAEW
jgi:hypothetical protein